MGNRFLGLGFGYFLGSGSGSGSGDRFRSLKHLQWQKNISTQAYKLVTGTDCPRKMDANKPANTKSLKGSLSRSVEV